MQTNEQTQTLRCFVNTGPIQQSQSLKMNQDEVLALEPQRREKKYLYFHGEQDNGADCKRFINHSSDPEGMQSLERVCV